MSSPTPSFLCMCGLPQRGAQQGHRCRLPDPHRLRLLGQCLEAEDEPRPFLQTVDNRRREFRLCRNETDARVKIRAAAIAVDLHAIAYRNGRQVRLRYEEADLDVLGW